MIAAAKPLILVIDDDEFVRQTLVDVLELNGFAVASAGDGEEGLALARRDMPSLVITDIEMPGLSGFDVLEQFRSDERLRGIPVIVISAKADRAATRRGMELGADDFLTKPFSEDEVIHSINARLEKKELLNELDAFAHTVAHDLKNPLATLIGRLGLLEMRLDTTDGPGRHRHIAEASLAANRLAVIVDDLLMLAGVRRQHITPEPLAMAAIVDEATDRLENLLQTTGARVRRPEAWPEALGHPPWITHVWVNLIGNAAKYGGPGADITLGYEVRPGAQRIRFWVQDRGPGVVAAAQAALFVPFSSISTIRADGHGLGLSIVRRIVDKLHGQVGVESRPGEGARFWFELPQPVPPVLPRPFPA